MGQHGIQSRRAVMRLKAKDEEHQMSTPHEEGVCQISYDEERTIQTTHLLILLSPIKGQLLLCCLRSCLLAVTGSKFHL